MEQRLVEGQGLGSALASRSMRVGAATAFSHRVSTAGSSLPFLLGYFFLSCTRSWGPYSLALLSHSFPFLFVSAITSCQELPPYFLLCLLFLIFPPGLLFPKLNCLTDW